MKNNVISSEFIYKNNNKYYFKKIFQFCSKKSFSVDTKTLIKNWKFQNYKKFYNVIDDIKIFLQDVPAEQNLLLQLINSITLFINNNLFVESTDILIKNITIQKIKNVNRFSKYNSKNLESFDRINFTVIGLKKIIPK